MSVDKFGNTWPDNFVVCPECGQPDNCGDCNHKSLSAEDVRSLGGVPAERLAVFFGPQEILDHYGDEEGENAEWVRNASDEQLLEVGYACLGSDSLWAEFHRLIEECVEELRGRETA